jgi:uncharacterized protein (DUF2236 family)
MAIREAVRHVERAIADPPRRRHVRCARGLGIHEGLMGVALLAGPANVVMQWRGPASATASWRAASKAAGWTCIRSKRARTTFTYLAVATAGSDAQKEAFRQAVNRAHAQVYSTPASPVQYNAFDVDLQLWVAACLYKGSVDIHRVNWTARTPTATTARG